MFVHSKTRTLMEGCGSTPHVLLDNHKRIVGVLAGRPKDDSWRDTTRAACDAMEQARGQCIFRDTDVEHRRGSYPCLAVGVSYGGGQQVILVTHLHFKHRLLKQCRSQEIFYIPREIKRPSNPSFATRPYKDLLGLETVRLVFLDLRMR